MSNTLRITKKVRIVRLHLTIWTVSNFVCFSFLFFFSSPQINQTADSRTAGEPVKDVAKVSAALGFL